MIFETLTPDSKEKEVLAKIEDLRTSLRFATAEPRRWTGLLRRMMFARAIQGSNSIEGYDVTLDDAIAAVEGEDQLETDEVSWAAVRGYRDAMTYVLGLADDPHFSYNTSLIRSLHFMMMNHDLRKHPGRWRPGPIYVRNSVNGEIVYEGPDAERVPDLMDELGAGLNAIDVRTPPLIRAAMAHLNLAMVHPFSDGNGRMARCLQTLVLAREGILAPEFSSIEEYLGKNTGDYYGVLAKVGQGYWQPDNDARPWVRFCLTAHYRQARTVLRRMKESARLWELLSEEVERRKLPERTLLALFDAATGFRVRRATYQPGADVSPNSASRDLGLLVEQGLLAAQGEKRGRTYMASDYLRSIRSRSLEVKIPIGDPFFEDVEHHPT